MVHNLGSVLNWERCNKSISYTKDILTVVPVHEELKELGLEVLVEIKQIEIFSLITTLMNQTGKTELMFEPKVFDLCSLKYFFFFLHGGDRDMVIPFVGTVKWMKSLNLTVVNDWRPWFVDGQVAGYTVKYSEHGYRLTYATVKGAGHTAPEYYCRECYYMFDRWIHYYPI
ncbi:hypothetical protein ACSBR1_019643 [Camellia fascicularis]